MWWFGSILRGNSVIVVDVVLVVEVVIVVVIFLGGCRGFFFFCVCGLILMGCSGLILVGCGGCSYGDQRWLEKIAPNIFGAKYCPF